MEKKTKQKSEEEGVSFEKAFSRLEEILEKLNSGATSLDESLKLYEEADTLIKTCTKKLNQAENKIEMLIKSRSGELSYDEGKTPKTTPFKLSSDKLS